MTLADLRRLAIKTSIRIRFPVSDGLECIVNEHGVAQVPGLRAVPSFNLEQDLARAARFTLEPVSAQGSKGPQTLGRDQLAALTGSPAAEAHDEHDE